MTELVPGRYYYCTACGGFYKRSKNARRPYLPCGHFPEYIREIAKEEYLAHRLKGKVLSQGNLESLNADISSNNKSMKQIVLSLTIFHYTLANLTIRTSYAADLV